MLFQNFQRLAFVVIMMEIFRSLHSTGIFQPVEDYLEDIRRRFAQGIFLIFIKVGGFLSVAMIIWRILALIHPIYYLIFFTSLYILYGNHNFSSVSEDAIVLNKGEILEDILQSDWDIVSKGVELNRTDDDWQVYE
jgi:hypothetical protein